MKRMLCLAASMVTLWACSNVVLAEPKVVVMKDGGQLTGELTKVGSDYKLVTKMGEITIPESRVAEIRDVPASQPKSNLRPQEEYLQRTVALRPDDVQGHYDLALWCREKGLFVQAMAELQVVLKLQPNHENAKLLQQLIAEQAATQLRPGQTAATGEAGALMGDKDIRRMRLEELRSADRVPVVFENKLLDRFVEQMRADGTFGRDDAESKFARMSAPERAVYMLLQTGDSPEIKKDILVKGDPQTMAFFKTQIWPMLQKSCASSACHGGPQGAGALKLYNIPGGGDPMHYTNFYILESYVSKQGQMIWRDHPQLSLLLQYGLPQDVAENKHSTMVKFAPLFDGATDRRYAAVAEWIGNMVSQRPAYETILDYKIPGRKVTTATAPAPTSAPAPVRAPAPATKGTAAKPRP